MPSSSSFFYHRVFFMLISIVCTASLRNIINHQRKYTFPAESRLFSFFNRKTLKTQPTILASEIMEISPNTQTRTLAYKNKSDGDEKESGEAPVKKNRLNRAQRKARLAAHLAANQAVLKREPESEILNLKRSVDPPAARIIKDAPMTASQKPRNPEKKPKVEQQQQQQENVVKKSNRAARRRNAPKKEIVNQSVGYREKVVIPAAVQHVNEMESEPQVEEEGEAAADDDISLPPPPLSTINTNHFTTVTFDSLPISFNTKRALIEVMKYK